MKTDSYRDETPVEVIHEKENDPLGGILERHPAFGMIGVAHVQGSPGARLFGSALVSHPGFIQLTISHGERRHHHGRDWFHGRDIVAEVWLSHAQFAEMITTPNVGSGVPCTIKYADKDVVPDFTPVDTEAEQIRKTVKDEAAKVVSDLKEARARVKSALGGASAKARMAVLDEFDTAISKLEGKLPYYVNALNESMESTTAAAKSEIEAFVSGAVRSAGLEAIANSTATLAIGGPVAKDGDK